MWKDLKLKPGVPVSQPRTRREWESAVWVRNSSASVPASHEHCLHSLRLVCDANGLSFLTAAARTSGSRSLHADGVNSIPFYWSSRCDLDIWHISYTASPTQSYERDEASVRISSARCCLLQIIGTKHTHAKILRYQSFHSILINAHMQTCMETSLHFWVKMPF